MPNFWLFKSEPSTWSWEMQIFKGEAGEPWSGVRNHQAKNNLIAMKAGELGFFYHSNEGKEIVGIVKVIKESYPDPTAEKSSPWVVVDVKAVKPFVTPVSLVEIKSRHELAEMALIKNSRLSVQPVTSSEWRNICQMGGVDAQI